MILCRFGARFVEKSSRGDSSCSEPTCTQSITTAHGAEEDTVLGGGRGGRAEEQHFFALPKDVRCVLW